MASMDFDIFINKKLLIKSVENRPILWDKTLEIYKDKNAKTEAWREICVILYNNFELMEAHERQVFGTLVVWKWTQLRGAWLRTLKAKNKYHQYFLFMNKVVNTGETQESVLDIEEEDNTSAEEYIKLTVDDIQKTEQGKDASQSETHNVAAPERRPVKRNFNDDERLKQKIIEHEDRNMSFFKAMLPYLAMLDDLQTLKFQAEVIKLIKNIKRRV